MPYGMPLRSLPISDSRRPLIFEYKDLGKVAFRMEAFDYIVVGGGAAGCVVASRSSEDPDTTDLLLEEGPHYRFIFISAPGGFFKTHVNPSRPARTINIRFCRGACWAAARRSTGCCRSGRGSAETTTTGAIPVAQVGVMRTCGPGFARPKAIVGIHAFTRHRRTAENIRWRASP